MDMCAIGYMPTQAKSRSPLRGDVPCNLDNFQATIKIRGTL